MGFKDELKRGIRNAMKDVEKEVQKTWRIDYQGHCVEIIHQLKKECLIIDGTEVDTNKRKSIFSYIIPYSKLSGTIDLEDGIKHTVSVKLGGYISFNCIIKIDNITVLDDALELDFLPWNHKEKIVPFIERQVQTHNKIVDDGLPDDEYLYDENHPPMAAGLSDHFLDEIPTPLYVRKLLKLFKRQLHQPTNKTRKATYEEIISDNIASYGEELIERFKQAEWDESLVQQEALWLLEHAAHREVVKFSITVLGCTNCEKYKELLFTLGMHEEFTLYVLFALKNGTKEANDQIWKLAQSVHGWGKIAAVEKLEATTPEIKQWLLTKGCENVNINEYFVYMCAIKGDLPAALNPETISKQLYDGAGLIIQTLLQEDVEHDIKDYLYENAVLFRFLDHARIHCQTLEDFYPLMKLCKFINAEEFWEERSKDRRKQQERISIQKAIQPFISHPKWAQLAMDKLQQDIDLKALEVAQFYQIDIVPSLFKLLEEHPTNNEIYFSIMNTNHRQYIIDLCIFAEHHLSLSSPSKEEESCLRYIVQDLHEHVGVGLPLIQAALESDTGLMQYQALSVLEEWTPSIWQRPGILAAIKNISTTTKDKYYRKLADHLLSK
ncbi:hypothetical protein M3647_26720 [Paenibacillus cellulositrophicus]|uniref:hypothetical protein n=1 Tax=Paenibacillus cellulositrophicus TaxID=562959 RepID=UPI00203D8EB4|nr:hypothetical protein [Paenibacillus cellulositrophicus]MCM3001083.1 hypothetical protein [Paenibacillus cellulositrophicus]